MDTTHHFDIGRAAVAAMAKGPDVVKLELVSLGATATLFGQKSALPTVSFKHHAFDRRRDVSR
jgi:hypothetical protein